jgi:hypothetical protein
LPAESTASRSTLDNRDAAHPIMSFSDQNESSGGWQEFTTKQAFDEKIKGWQDFAGRAYSAPGRKPTG